MKGNPVDGGRSCSAKSDWLLEEKLSKLTLAKIGRDIVSI